MKLIKLSVSLLLLTSAILLTGCEDKISKEAEKNRKQNEESQKKHELIEKKNAAEKEELYKEMEKPLDEVIQENDLDAAKEITNPKVIEKDSYIDAQEFANYVSEQLYLFYTNRLSPQQYYNFLKKFGDKNIKKQYPTEEDAINILTSIQEMYKKANTTGESHTVTKVEYNRLKTEASFYRKVITAQGVEYFITTIKKENQGWKFSSDDPSPPYTAGSHAQRKI